MNKEKIIYDRATSEALGWVGTWCIISSVAISFIPPLAFMFTFPMIGLMLLGFLLWCISDTKMFLSLCFNGDNSKYMNMWKRTVLQSMFFWPIAFIWFFVSMPTTIAVILGVVLFMWLVHFTNKETEAQKNLRLYLG